MSFSYFTRLLGIVSVVEEKGRVTISGLDAEAFIRDIRNNWNTSRFDKNAIIASTSSKLTFFSFFAIEFDFILTELVKSRRTNLPKRVLLQVQEKLRANTWLKRLDDPRVIKRVVNKNKLSDLTVDLFRYQEDFLDLYNDQTQRYGLRGYILGDRPGTGKTITGIALHHCLGTKTKIIIAPKNSLYEPWEKTLSEVFVNKPTMYLSDAQDPEHRKLVPGLDYYVFHYEALDQALAFVNRHHKELGSISITLDESHNLNESSRTLTLRTSLFLSLCKYGEHILWQSGTVFRHMGNEIIPCFRTIDPMFTQFVEERFRPIYGVNANRARDILAHRIGLITRVVEAKTPEPTYLELNAEIPGGERFKLSVIKERMREFVTERLTYYKKHEDEFEKDYFALVEVARKKGRIPDGLMNEYLKITTTLHDGYDPIGHKGMPEQANKFEASYILPHLDRDQKIRFNDVRSVYKYMDLKVQGEALGRILGTERALCAAAIGSFQGEFVNLSDRDDRYTIKDLIDSAPSKTVIFTSYVQAVLDTEKSLREQGFDPLVVYGETNADLTAIRREFTNNPAKNPLIATYQSLSTAVPLVMASRTLTLNQPFRDLVRKQAVARTSRIGQEHPTTFVDLYIDTGNEPNISERNRDILQWSREAVEQIMGRTVVSIAAESLERGLVAGMDQDGFSSLLGGATLAYEALAEVLAEDLPEDVTYSIENFGGSGRSAEVLNW